MHRCALKWESLNSSSVNQLKTNFIFNSTKLVDVVNKFILSISTSSLSFPFHPESANRRKKEPWEPLLPRTEAEHVLLLVPLYYKLPFVFPSQDDSRTIFDLSFPQNKHSVFCQKSMLTRWYDFDTQTGKKTSKISSFYNILIFDKLIYMVIGWVDF